MSCLEVSKFTRILISSATLLKFLDYFQGCTFVYPAGTIRLIAAFECKLKCLKYYKVVDGKCKVNGAGILQCKCDGMHKDTPVYGTWTASSDED